MSRTKSMWRLFGICWKRPALWTAAFWTALIVLAICWSFEQCRQAAVEAARVGDVRGELSTAVPLAPLQTTQRQRWLLITAVHLLLWFCGLGLIWMGHLRLKRQVSRGERLKKAIRRMAHYDKLTGLPNLVLFNDRLRLAIVHARRCGEPLAVLCLDLDHFKKINSTFGHGSGDQVLREVAGRLTCSLHEDDTVARLGGDSYLILLPNIRQAEDVGLIMGKILKTLQEPFYVEDQAIYVTASVGVSLYPGDGEDALALLKNADTALHRAKEAGRNGYRLYAPAMNARARERLQLENDLRRGLAEEEFVLYYQPQINVRTGAITGAEALLRWHHPQRGLLVPAAFIPAAEEIGLIVPLGEWVLRTACRQVREWQMAALPPLRVAVNLSARQFRQPDLVETVRRIVTEAGVDPCRLGVEITESAIMEEPQRTAAALRELKAMGLNIAIDDFGTGYSSLGYLKLFPVDILKVDRSFVIDLPGDADSASIVGAIVALARSLNLKVLAEGAETPAQHDILRHLDCHEIQGFLYSPPLPAEAFCGYLLSGQVAGSTTVPQIASLDI